MTWNEGCEKLIVLIRREAVEAQFESLTHERMRAIEFQTGVDLTGAVGQAIWQHAQMMLGAAEAGGGMPDAYRVLLRDGLTTLLLSSLPSSVLSASTCCCAPGPEISNMRLASASETVSSS